MTNLVFQEVVVFFVDYGNVEQVALSDIRCLTKETAEIPAQAISCRLYGLKPIKVSYQVNRSLIVDWG